MKIPCPYCTEEVLYDPKLAGKTITCSYCKKSLKIPLLHQLKRKYQEEYREEQERLREEQEYQERILEMKAARELQKQEKERLEQEWFEQERMKNHNIERAIKGKNSGKVFWQRVVYFFDFKLERYLTPQIIRISWVLLLALSFCGLGLMLVTKLPMVAPQTKMVPNTQRYAIAEQIIYLKALIEGKKWDEQLEKSKRKRIEKEIRPVPENVKAEPIYKNQYAKFNLAQLRSELVKLEQKYSEYIQEDDYNGALWYVLLVATGTISTIITILIARVLCELCIVIFNIANSLANIRDTLASKQSVDTSPPVL